MRLRTQGFSGGKGLGTAVGEGRGGRCARASARDRRQECDHTPWHAFALPGHADARRDHRDAEPVRYNRYRNTRAGSFGGALKDRWDRYHATIFDIETNDETAEIWNNVFHVQSETAGADPTFLSMARGEGVHHFGVNLVSPGIDDVRNLAESGETFEGTITGWDSRLAHRIKLKLEGDFATVS